MKKLKVSSLLRDDKNIISFLQAALQEQAAEENLELPVRQRSESLSWWAETLIETKKINLN